MASIGDSRDDELDLNEGLLQDALPGPLTLFPPGELVRAPEGFDLRAGQEIGGYRLVAPIGRGGMGQVWEAEQLSLGGRRIAMKFVRPERVTARQLAYFEREARAGGRLAHPGLVAVHASGRSDGLAWIAMELVAGCRTLHDFLAEAARSERLPADYDKSVARCVEEIAAALQAAHEAGVVHRDLKPQNVLVTRDGHPKVGDFGLARILDESALSDTGQMMGTLLYMSPEQVAARRDAIDHRTDIFSLGVLLYELLTLQRPFQGDTSRQIAEQIASRDPLDPRRIRSRIPRDLVVICLKSLEKLPERRYATMTEVAADLRRFLAHEPIRARPPGWLGRAERWVRRRPARAAALLLAVSALAIGFIALRRIQSESAQRAALESIAARRTFLDRLEELQQGFDPLRIEDSHAATASAIRESAELDPKQPLAATPEPEWIDPQALSRSLVSHLPEIGIDLRREDARALAAITRRFDADFQGSLLEAFYLNGEALLYSGAAQRALRSASNDDEDVLIWRKLEELLAELDRDPLQRRAWRSLVAFRLEQLAPEPALAAELAAGKSALGFLWLANARRARAELTEASELLDLALVLRPNSYRAQVARASVATRLDDPRRAQAHLWSAAALRPQSGRAWWALAGAYDAAQSRSKETEDRVLAERCYRRAIELNPKRSGPYSGLAHLVKNPEAAELLERARVETEADVFIYLGLQVFGGKRKLEYGLEGVERFPNHAPLRFNLGLDLDDAERDDEAVEQYERAVEIDPKLWQASTNLCYLLQIRYTRLAEDHPERAGLVERATSAAERAYELAPAVPTNAINMASCLVGVGRNSAAIDLLEPRIAEREIREALSQLAAEVRGDQSEGSAELLQRLEELLAAAGQQADAK